MLQKVIVVTVIKHSYEPKESDATRASARCPQASLEHGDGMERVSRALISVSGGGSLRKCFLV